MKQPWLEMYNSVCTTGFDLFSLHRKKSRSKDLKFGSDLQEKQFF